VPQHGSKIGVYLAKYDSAAGTTLWSQGFGNGAQDQLAGGVAASASGGVVVVGSYKNAVDFGGGEIPNQGTHFGIFVAAYDGEGQHQWSHGFSNTASDQLAEDVVIDAAGNVVVVGSVLGTVSVGGDDLSAPTRRHVLVAKYDSAGNHLWSHAFGSGTADSTARSVAVDAGGNVIVAGRFGGTVAFGETPLTSLGTTQDAFVMTLSPDGAHLCSFGYGNDTETTYAEGVAADGNGDLRIVGHFLDPVDFGSGTVLPTELGKYAIYLLRYQR
jgi:outer membrane protein assembly factor BamB